MWGALLRRGAEHPGGAGGVCGDRMGTQLVKEGAVETEPRDRRLARHLRTCRGQTRSEPPSAEEAPGGRARRLLTARILTPYPPGREKRGPGAEAGRRGQ